MNGILDTQSISPKIAYGMLDTQSISPKIAKVMENVCRKVLKIFLKLK
jgi:hypothetical protein